MSFGRRPRNARQVLIVNSASVNDLTIGVENNNFRSPRNLQLIGKPVFIVFGKLESDLLIFDVRIDLFK